MLIAVLVLFLSCSCNTAQCRFFPCFKTVCYFWNSLVINVEFNFFFLLIVFIFIFKPVAHLQSIYCRCQHGRIFSFQSNCGIHGLPSIAAPFESFLIPCKGSPTETGFAVQNQFCWRTFHVEITLIYKIIYKQSFAYEKLQSTVRTSHSTKNSENLEMGTNGMEISWEKFQKIWKLLIFRKAIESLNRKFCKFRKKSRMERKLW